MTAKISFITHSLPALRRRWANRGAGGRERRFNIVALVQDRPLERLVQNSSPRIRTQGARRQEKQLSCTNSGDGRERTRDTSLAPRVCAVIASQIVDRTPTIQPLKFSPS